MSRERTDDSFHGGGGGVGRSGISSREASVIPRLGSRERLDKRVASPHSFSLLVRGAPFLPPILSLAAGWWSQLISAVLLDGVRCDCSTGPKGDLQSDEMLKMPANVGVGFLLRHRVSFPFRVMLCLVVNYLFIISRPLA